MSEIDEVARATQELAKLGAKGLDTAEKAGTFFAKVFKEPITEVSGMMTDKLRFIRWSRLVEMSEQVNEILTQKGIDETRAVPPKIALPIFEEATLEDEPALRDLWNRLLANAMDPSFNDEVRYGFIDMIKGITGREVQILSSFYNKLCQVDGLRPLSEVSNYSLTKEQVIQDLNLSTDDYAISVNNLMRMQLLAPAVLIDNGVMIGPEPMTLYKGINQITLTPLGVKFVEACIK